MLSRLGDVARYVTTPGLNSVFEGLYADVPMLFLPPQNATQVAQLRAYEAAGLVASGLNLSDLDPAFPEDVTGIPERELTELVLTTLPTLGRPELAHHVRDHLGRQLRELVARADARSAFREMLGPPGGQTIAKAISAWWEEQWM
jgi:UDP-N-acetylglucosamine:LPS N-acetylglucosamine transferase